VHFDFAVKKSATFAAMVAANHGLPDLDALNHNELKALIFSQHEQLLSKDERLASRQAEIEHLKLWIRIQQNPLTHLGTETRSVERRRKRTA
jgi:hypothetical protein